MLDRLTRLGSDLSAPVGIPESMVAHLDFLGDWGVFATDVDLKITVWNRWLAQRSGIHSSKILGRSLLDVFPDLAPRSIDRVYREVLAGRPVVRSQSLHSYLIALPSALAGGRPSSMQQSVRIIPLTNGDVVSGTITLIEDVTERVVHEAELQAHARRQGAIASAAKVALTGKEVDDVAREMVNLIAETLEADLVEVLERLPDRTSWARIAGRGWTEPVLTTFDGNVAAFSQADVEIGGVFQSDDVANDRRFQNKPVFTKMAFTRPW